MRNNLEHQSESLSEITNKFYHVVFQHSKQGMKIFALNRTSSLNSLHNVNGLQNCSFDEFMSENRF